jgi:hypothetical protein
MSVSVMSQVASGAVRRNANHAIKIPEMSRVILKNPKTFSAILKCKKTHPDKEDSSLTYWISLSEAEVMRLRLNEGDRITVAIMSVEKATEDEEKEAFMIQSS